MIRVAIEAKLTELSNKEELSTLEANLLRDCEIALGKTSARPVTVAAALKRCCKAMGI